MYSRHDPIDIPRRGMLNSRRPVKMKNKRTFIAAAIVISFAIAAAYSVNFYLHRKNAPRLSKTSDVFARLMADHRPLSFFLEPILKIRLKVPDTLILDNSLYRMTAYNDSMLIIVNQVERQLLLVDNEGRILKAVGEAGGGPGEFMDITCFAVSSLGSIYLYDHLQQRFTIFDSNGKLLKIFGLKTPGIQVRHIVIDKNQMIFVHHPPSKEYPAFISVFDSNGTFVKNLRSGVDWAYTNYYLRGFLDGDLMITRNGDIIESNDFSYRIYVGDTMDKFRAVGEKPSGYKDPPVIEIDSPEEYMKVAVKLSTPRVFLSYQESVILQHYLTPEAMAKGLNGIFRAIDVSGDYLGEMASDVGMIPNMGNPSYTISLALRMENGRWNQRVPYDFIIYRWKTLSELQGDSTQSAPVPVDTAKGIKMLKELGSLTNIEAIGFISQKDCETCDEILISELNQLKLKLRDKSKSVVLAVINSDKQFSRDLELRYGGILNIVPISRPVSLTSPAVFLNSNGVFAHLTIESTKSSLMEFTHRMDSVMSALR